MSKKLIIKLFSFTAGLVRSAAANISSGGGLVTSVAIFS